MLSLPSLTSLTYLLSTSYNYFILGIILANRKDMNAKFGERKMKKGLRPDSSKAILIGALVVVFLAHTPKMSRAGSLDSLPMPREAALLEYVVTETSLADVGSHLNIGFTELGLTDADAIEPEPETAATLNPARPQLNLMNPPTMTFRPKRTDKTFLITTLSTTVILQAADYVTTMNALKYSSLQEANPLLKNVVSDPLLFAAVKLCVTGLEVLLLKKLHDNNRTLAWVVGTALNVAVSYVVANNLSKIQLAQNL